MENLNAKLCRALKALSANINTACELYNLNYFNSYRGISWWEMFVSQCIYKQPNLAPLIDTEAVSVLPAI